MHWLTVPFLLLVGCLAAEEQPCTTHSNGKYYDLSPLKASKDYEAKTAEGHVFSINVCRTPVTEVYGLKDVDAAEIGGVVRRNHGHFAIGKLNTTLSVEDFRPRITLTDGSQCKTKTGGQSEIRASTVIEFVCDTSVYGAGSPRLVAQLPPGSDNEACAFFFEWRTHVACATSEPGGAWGFFAFLMVMILAVALLYLVAGTLYNRFVLQLRGIDQIPQFSFESMKYHAGEAIDWLKDMAMVLRSNYGPQSPSSYTRANTDFQTPFSGRTNSAGINPISHQTQVSASVGSEASAQFVRPHIPRTTSQRGADINPVSHQAQISAILPAPVPLAAVDVASRKPKARPKPLDIESQEHEREFMLGDDEEGEDVTVQGSSQPAPEATELQARPAIQTQPSGNPPS